MHTAFRSKRNRTVRGAAVAEFAAGLAIFICFFFVPIVNLLFVPARYLLVRTYLENVAHHMALCEKRSDAMQYLNDQTWRSAIDRLGVNIKSAQANIIICDNSGTDIYSLSGIAPMPPQYLPNSKNAPHIYALELSVVADVPPLFGGNKELPGFTGPITLTFKSRSQWENLSPDPVTGTYFIDE